MVEPTIFSSLFFIFIWCAIIICTLLFLRHLLFYTEDIVKQKLFDMLPQIKPHWFWGNNSFDHAYKVMNGLRFCAWYTGRKRQLLILDSDLINTIMVTEFNHFVDVPFLDPQYSKVSYQNAYMLRSKLRYEYRHCQKHAITFQFLVLVHGKSSRNS